MNCDKEGIEHAKIIDLKELDLKKTLNQGCIRCFDCNGLIHRECLDDTTTQMTKYSFRCNKSEQVKLMNELFKEKERETIVPKNGFSGMISEENLLEGVRKRILVEQCPNMVLVTKKKKPLPRRRRRQSPKKKEKFKHSKLDKHLKNNGDESKLNTSHTDENISSQSDSSDSEYDRTLFKKIRTK